MLEMTVHTREAVFLVVRLVLRRTELSGTKALVLSADDRIDITRATERVLWRRPMLRVCQAEGRGEEKPHRAEKHH
jgi:hypothetical protein